MNAARELLIERLVRHRRDLVNGGTSASELRDDLKDAAAVLRKEAELIKVATGAWHMLESLLAVRDGVPDDGILTMAVALRAAIEQAERLHVRE